MTLSRWQRKLYRRQRNPCRKGRQPEQTGSFESKRARQFENSLHQNVAIGLSGDPVPPLIGSGAAVTRNSQRLRAAAASLRASRSQLSIKWIPNDTRAKSWIAPVRSDGETYCG